MPHTSQKAIFAAGCFWGVEEAFRTMPGVVSTRVGYIGGMTDEPTYKEVCSHATGHAEAVEVTFDPEQVTYGDLLEKFWSIHDPTQVNRQGPDVGDQYRSAIFATTEAQYREATATKKARGEAGAYNAPIATQITMAPTFWEAEEYHQQYVLKNSGAACHI